MYFYSSYDVTPIYVYTHLRFKFKSNVNQIQRVVRNVTLTPNLWKKLNSSSNNLFADITRALK